MQHSIPTPVRRNAIPKAPTGIQGLDGITDGRVPRGRPTLVCGGLRAELRRLLRWLKDKGLTAVITAERGERRRVPELVNKIIGDPSNTQRVLAGLEVSMGTA